MKEIVFGGFCMITGALLLWLSNAERIYFDYDFTSLVEIFGILLLLGGFVLGLTGMKKE